jgi:hypothetical protein
MLPDFCLSAGFTQLNKPNETKPNRKLTVKNGKKVALITGITGQDDRYARFALDSRIDF